MHLQGEKLVLDSNYFKPASPINFSTQAETFLNALAKMVVLVLDVNFSLIE
jgi:hypothetical protein